MLNAASMAGKRRCGCSCRSRSIPHQRATLADSNSLEEIVRRGRLPFAQLLAELVQDQGAWRNALTSAGIKPPE